MDDVQARMVRMQAATAALAAAATVHEVAATLTEQIASALGAEGAMAVLVAADGETLELIGAAGVPEDVLANWRRFPLEADVPLAVAIRGCQPQWPQTAAERMQRYPHLRDNYATSADVSWLSLPLLFEGRAIGGLSVRFAGGRTFADADRAYALALAGLAAQALERARLFEAEQQARQRAEAAAARIASLQSITAALSRAMTPAEVAATVIEHALPGIGAAAGAVGILLPDGEWIELVASIGYPDEMTTALRRIPISATTPMAEAVRSGRPAWREQGHAAVDGQQYADYARVNQQRFPSGAGIPLAVNGRVLGGLGLSFASPASATFGPAEREFMLAVGAQCAQALERSRLYEAEHRSRQAAERTAAQLDAILGSVTDAIIAQDPAGQLVYANAAAASMAGEPSTSALLNLSVADLLDRFEVRDEHDRPLAPYELPVARALAGEVVHERLLHLRLRATGQERWTMTSAVPVRDAAGDTLLAISILRDVTERRRARQRTRALVEMGTLLPASLDVETALQGIVSTLVRTVADGCAVLLVGPDGALQHTAVAHADAARTPRLERAIADVATLDEGLLHSGPPRVLLPDTDRGLLLLEALAAEVAVVAPLAARERVLGALLLLGDVGGRTLGPDDLEMAEEIARRAALAIDNLQLYAAAQDAVRARDDFLSIAAHELRTPLTAVKGVAQLLLRAQEQGRLDTSRLQRHLDALVSQSSRLAQLTDDLLDVSRLRTGRLELRLQVLELGSLVAASLEHYGEILDDQHPLRFHHAPTCPVLVDPDRLDQVLGNVVSNAAKYSPAGGPIDLHVRPSDGGALLEVSDRGIGLTPGTEEVIFEPFGRAPNAARRQIPGMGLGLHISREIVLRHGGRMWATSGGEDQGTTIAVWLPCAPSPAT